MDSIPNPFTNRGMTTDPANFFGREEQINAIISRLRNMQSCSVVGQRRIGKSSLLYHLGQRGTQTLEDPAYRFYYLDLHDARLHTTAGFFQTILSKLGITTKAIRAKNTLNHNLIAFSDQIESLERSGQRIILCLDEFENTFAHRDHFTEDFFDHMRSQLQIRRLAFITATQHPLQSLSLKGKLTSTFYNIFTTVELGEFTEQEVYQFLEVQNVRVDFTEVELTFILTHLQLHPLKLQILCDWVFKNRWRKLSDWLLVEEINKEFGNFFVGTFDAKQFLRLSKAMSLDNLKRLLETIKTGREIIAVSKR